MTALDAMDALRKTKTCLRNALGNLEKLRPQAETDQLERVLAGIELDVRHALAYVGDLQLLQVLQRAAEQEHGDAATPRV